VDDSEAQRRVANVGEGNKVSIANWDGISLTFSENKALFGCRSYDIVT
jgi:hypothetical protein